VRLFCAYTGVGILLAYLSMLFIFIPIMVLDARREEAGLSSWTCQPVDPESETKITSPRAIQASQETVATSTRGTAEAAKRPGSPSQVVPTKASTSTNTDADADSAEEEDKDYVGASWDEFFADTLAPAILSPVGKVTIFVVWFAVLGVSAWGFTELGQGLALQQLAPNGHYFIAAQDTEDEFFNLGFPLDTVVPSGEPSDSGSVDFKLAATRRAFSEYGAAVVAADEYADSADEVWTTPFSAYLANQSPSLETTDLSEDQFREQLIGFLSDPPASGPVLEVISLRDPRDGSYYKAVQGVPQAVADMRAGVNVQVSGSIVVVRTRVLSGEEEQPKAMVSMRDSIREVAKQLE